MIVDLDWLILTDYRELCRCMEAIVSPHTCEGTSTRSRIPSSHIKFYNPQNGTLEITWLRLNKQ